jgi:hypothetical protein
LRLATSTAVVLALTAGALTVKLAEVKPAATATEEGMVKLDPAARPMDKVSPVAGAAAETVAVHVAEPGVVTVAGAHISPVTAYGCAMLTSPPVAVTARALSVNAAPVVLITWIGDDVLVGVGDTVNVAVATTPPLMTVLFTPKRRHV